MGIMQKLLDALKVKEVVDENDSDIQTEMVTEFNSEASTNDECIDMSFDYESSTCLKSNITSGQTESGTDKNLMDDELKKRLSKKTVRIKAIVNLLKTTDNEKFFEYGVAELQQNLDYLQQYKNANIVFVNNILLEAEELVKNESVYRSQLKSRQREWYEGCRELSIETFAKACNEYLRKQDYKNEEIQKDDKVPFRKYEEVQSGSRNEERYNFDKMDRFSFEHFCAELLKKLGYEDVWVTQKSNDQGIDIIAHRDGIKFGIQCKCYESDVGNKAIQEAIAGRTYYHCHVAAVLTNRYFTQSARDLADSANILLWDRGFLKEMIHKAKQLE